MATFTSICFAMTLLVVASNAAPNQKFNLKVPDECKGKGFCAIKPEGYDEIQAMIDSFLTPTFIAQNIGDRLGEPEKREELSPKDDWHNCPYRKTFDESPYLFSVSNDSAPDYVIQSKFFRQPVESVTCANEKISSTDTESSEECFQHLDLKTFNMKSTCKTSTARRTLLVFDFDTQKPVQKSYDIPCCCTCHIVRSY